MKMTCVPLYSLLDGSRLSNNIKGHPGLMANFESGKCKIRLWTWLERCLLRCLTTTFASGMIRIRICHIQVF